MQIDKLIYALLLEGAGGQPKNINGLSSPILRDMKNGKGNTSFVKLFEVLQKNGITKASFSTKETTMSLDMETQEAVFNTLKEIKKPLITVQAVENK